MGGSVSVPGQEKQLLACLFLMAKGCRGDSCSWKTRAKEATIYLSCSAREEVRLTISFEHVEGKVK